MQYWQNRQKINKTDTQTVHETGRSRRKNAMNIHLPVKTVFSEYSKDCI